MTIKDALTAAYKQLKKADITSARLDAEVILSFVLKKSKEYLYTYPEKELTKGQSRRFKLYISKRAKLLPVAYITNNKEFFGLDFFVNKNVLIPRPETELLIEHAFKSVQTQNFASPHQRIKVIDVGTGSGCIAISLAKKLPNAKIFATDISKKALVVAKKNAKRHRVLSKINFHQGDLLELWPRGCASNSFEAKNKKIDILIANLPYLSDFAPNSFGVSLKYEPPQAIFTKEKGLHLYKKSFKQISNLKYRPKLILIEIDPRQTVALKKIIKADLPNAGILIIKDLAGRNRVIKIINQGDLIKLA